MDYELELLINPPGGNENSEQTNQDRQATNEPEQDPTSGIIPNLERMNIDGGQAFQFESTMNGCTTPRTMHMHHLLPNSWFLIWNYQTTLRRRIISRR